MKGTCSYCTQDEAYFRLFFLIVREIHEFNFTCTVIISNTIDFTQGGMGYVWVLVVFNIITRKFELIKCVQISQPICKSTGALLTLIIRKQSLRRTFERCIKLKWGCALWGTSCCQRPRLSWLKNSTMVAHKDHNSVEETFQWPDKIRKHLYASPFGYLLQHTFFNSNPPLPSLHIIHLSSHIIFFIIS